MIEAIFFVDVDGLHAYRANGIVRRSLAELAQALDVAETDIKLGIDAEQLRAEQKRLRRPTRARGVDFNPF